MWKYLLGWVPLIFIAIGNGVFRENFLANHLNELRAHQASTASLVVLFAIYMWVIFRIWKPVSAQQSISIGVVWLILTVAFEFLFGRYVAGHSWTSLLQDYNIFAGRLWVVILVWVVVAPYLFYRFQK